MKSFYSNWFLNYWPKNEKHSNELRGVNIDQSAMCCRSMDLSQQALQINGKLFFNFGITFQFNYNF